jgi:hypothetical protein
MLTGLARASLGSREEAIILDIADKGPPFVSCPLNRAIVGLSGVAHHNEAVLLSDLETFPRCAEASRTPSGLPWPPGPVRCHMSHNLLKK